jgi:hypothetical protein
MCPTCWTCGSPVINLERLPTTGRCVVVANHPTGIADGIAVYDAIRPRRADIVFFANSDALRVSPRLGETVIPVEWVPDKRTRDRRPACHLAGMTKDAFEAERPVVCSPPGGWPAGADGVLTDPEWMHPTAAVAGDANTTRRSSRSMSPAPDSSLFHLLRPVSQELRDVTLFHELLNKTGRRFRLWSASRSRPTASISTRRSRARRSRPITERVLPVSARRALRMTPPATGSISTTTPTTRLGEAIAPLLDRRSGLPDGPWGHGQVDAGARR